MLFTFLLVVHALIAAALVGVILMQRSEGGGLGMGSGPSGLMTARGAADFLTRATSVLATLFVLMAFLLATLASLRNGGGNIDTSLAHKTAPGPINAPAAPTSAIPMMGAPAPAAPDSLTPQSSAPAPTGAPANDTGPAAKNAPEPARPIPSITHLKTIDTHVGNSTVGINGLGGSGNSSAPAKSAPPVVTPPAPVIKAPAPTKSDSTPPATGGPAAGNSAQPQ
jgi:preprotein translocase subunit SecG